MTPNTHTPTPWSYTGNKEWATIYHVETHEHIAAIMTKGSKKENAEHIVHCVNTHDALVEASKQYLEAVRVCINNGFEGPQFDAMAMASGALRYALAKAEKGVES